MSDTATRADALHKSAIEAEELTARDQYKALAALCLGYFMVILDTTVVNVALPDIQRQFGAAFSSLQWVVDGYALVFASLLLTGGAVADRLGSRRTYLTGFALFTAASALCGAAPSLWLLLLARAAQGMGGALLVQASLALLRATFPASARRATAVSIWAATAGVAAGGGPVVGGLLIGVLGWRSAFIVNVPVGVLGLFLTTRYVRASAQPQRERLDMLGPFASICALGGFT